MCSASQDGRIDRLSWRVTIRGFGKVAPFVFPSSRTEVSPPAQIGGRRMNHTTVNNGDEAGEADSHIHEVVDDVELDSAAEEEPLTLDPSTSSLNIPLLSSRHLLTCLLLAQDPSLSGLREISSLASWSVSTHKPSCGVDALRNLDPSQFWQSDGPQPHLLTIHFFKLVKIVKMRVYLDFRLDESYTPTKMQFWGGTGMYDLVSLHLARSRSETIRTDDEGGTGSILRMAW